LLERASPVCPTSGKGVLLFEKLTLFREKNCAFSPYSRGEALPSGANSLLSLRKEDHFPKEKKHPSLDDPSHPLLNGAHVIHTAGSPLYVFYVKGLTLRGTVFLPMVGGFLLSRRTAATFPPGTSQSLASASISLPPFSILLFFSFLAHIGTPLAHSRGPCRSQGRWTRLKIYWIP